MEQESFITRESNSGKATMTKVTGVDIVIDTSFLEEFRKKKDEFPEAEYNDVVVTIDGETRKFTFEDFKNRLFNMATL